MDEPMKFGIFLAPFHPVGQNPTLALERDLELIQHLDALGFDEAWIGEHHSAGYEIIASPEVFIATAAERTRHIKLGTGVSSLPYHHPLLLADRMVLLDHLTRGRAMLGVGPGVDDALGVVRVTVVGDASGEDGMQLAKKLRETTQIPIIIVSGRKDEADRVMGLELGADDYMVKPFSPRELLARVRAVLRRYKTASEVLPARDEKRRAYRFAGWELNLRTRRLTGPGSKRVELSNGEFSLLEAFCAAPQRVLSREQLLEFSRLHNDEVYDRSVDVQVGRLRKKIEPKGTRAQLIRTERGAGYVFTAAVETVR